MQTHNIMPYPKDGYFRTSPACARKYAKLFHIEAYRLLGYTGVYEECPRDIGMQVVRMESAFSEDYSRGHHLFAQTRDDNDVLAVAQAIVKQWRNR